MRLRAASIVAITFLSGCVSIPSSFQMTVEKPLRSAPSYKFVDLRKAEDKVFRSPEASGLPYHVYGDENFSPDRVEQLKAHLEHRLGEFLKGKVVELEQFEVSVHSPTIGELQDRAGTGSTTMAASGVPVLQTAGANVLGNAIARGLPTGRSNVAVRLRLKVDGVMVDGYEVGNIRSEDLASSMPRLFEAAFKALVATIDFRLRLSRP